MTSVARVVDAFEQRREEFDAGFEEPHFVADGKAQPRRTPPGKQSLPQARESAPLAETDHRLCSARRSGNCRIASRFDHEKQRVGCLTEGQPQMRRMLARRERDFEAVRHEQAELVLGVARHALGIAMPPFADRCRIRCGDASRAGDRCGTSFAADDDSRLLGHFARGRLDERFVDAVFRARHRLPEARVIGAFDDQHVELGRMDDDENGFGDFRRLGCIVVTARVHVVFIMADECNPKNEKGALGAFFFRWALLQQPSSLA